MKILLTSDMYENQINGVSGSVITLRDELRKKGHDVRVLTLSKDSESKMVKTDYLIGSFSVPFYPDVRQTIHFRDPIINDVIKWNPDIIHIQTEFSICKISKKIAKACNCPHIATSHTFWEDYTGYLIPGKRLGKMVAKRFVRRAYKGARAIIIPTEKMRSVLERYGITTPIYAIPTGIDLDRFKKKFTSFEKTKLKGKLGIKNNAKVLVSIGRVAKEKNLDEIIDYLPRLIERDKNIILLIGGDGPHKKNLEAKVKKLKLEKYVRFTGMIPPKYTYKYFSLGDVFVCASTSETQGITYIEAQACGVPLVCRYDKCLDNVVINGKNGFTYETEDEYVENIFKILHNPFLHMKLKNNTRKVVENFSKEKFGDDVEKLYMDVIKEFKKEGADNES